MNLTVDELFLYREWIEDNRELERLVKECATFRRVCWPHNRQKDPMSPRDTGSPAVTATTILRTLNPAR